jgi:hypothetical protein
MQKGCTLLGGQTPTAVLCAIALQLLMIRPFNSVYRLCNVVRLFTERVDSQRVRAHIKQLCSVGCNWYSSASMRPLVKCKVMTHILDMITFYTTHSVSSASITQMM